MNEFMTNFINPFFYWVAWIIIPIIVEVIPSIGSFFSLLVHRNKHKNDEDPIERHGEYIMVGLLHMFWMLLIVGPVVGALGVGISGCIEKIEGINKKYKSAEAKLKE